MSEHREAVAQRLETIMEALEGNRSELRSVLQQERDLDRFYEIDQAQRKLTGAIKILDKGISTVRDDSPPSTVI